jgi:hypothetical protein
MPKALTLLGKITPARPLIWSVLLVGVLSAESAQAANWYVRPNGGAYGSENGVDWNNAFDGFSGIAWSSVACGDIIWVAGGTYTQGLTPSKNCTTGSRLELRRARSDASAVTNAPGWSSAFDSLVNQGNSGSLNFGSNASGILISGRTTAAGAVCGSSPTSLPAAPNVSGCGWRLSRTATTSGCGICVNASSSGNWIEYLDIQGPGEISYSSDGRAIDLTPASGTASTYTFSHLVIRDWESAIYAVSCSSPTFEYLDVSNIAPTNTATLHPNGIITWGCPNGIVRHSVFHKGTNTGIDIGEGIFFEQGGGSGNWQIYGNVFYDITGTRKAIQISANVGAIKIFNNTFHTVSLGAVRFSDSPSCAGGEYRNNLAYAASHSTSQGGCSLAASNNVTCSSTACWSNAAGRDYHIVSTTGAGFGRNAGTNLGSAYNTDRDGVVRGADGTWDVGAYEFGAPCTSCPAAPAPPANVRVVR